MEALGFPQSAAVRMLEIAWDLCYDDPRFSHPTRALELVERSLNLQPEPRPSAELAKWHWLVRGVAHGRAGQWDAAVRDFARLSARERDELQPVLGFFLAVAYHHLSDSEQARSWYDRSVAWLSTHDQSDRYALRFRAEAEALLRSEGRGEAMPNGSDAFAP
jgi:hypothetical protein